MLLKTRRWGTPDSDSVVCIHGVAQHGGVFAGLAETLASGGRSVVAVDLRGHGESTRNPPWDTATHVRDLLETIEDLGIERATWIGHSFGGRLAAAAAAESTPSSAGLVLLDPGLEVPPALALQSAEIERLDWSFATIDGAVNALLSSESIVAAPQSVVEGYVKEDVRKGADGRFRFRFCPSAAVVAWSDVTLPAPPIAPLPTLVVSPEVPLVDPGPQRARYEEALGDQLTWATVPNGHHVLWEAPVETLETIERFLA